MKKQYIKKTVAIYTVSITNMVAGIGSTAKKTEDSAENLENISEEERELLYGGGDTDARNGGGGSIWDNAW